MSRRPATSGSWKKGQSGNPKGKPISILRKESIKEMLEIGTPELKNVFINIIDQAKQGSIQASRLFLEYILPKPNSNLEEEKDVFDNLTDEETKKLYDFLLTMMEKENVTKFIEQATKVTAFVKEMKSRRVVYN